MNKGKANMISATVTSKGQVTLPAALRAELNISAGDRINFIKLDEGRFEVVAATQDISELRGMLKSDNVVSLDEMSDAIKGKVRNSMDSEQ